MRAASREFGRRLRLERERRGISLQAIADSSKIGRSLLEDLERGDVSKWPGGIYRRGFVRAYAAAIGLTADEMLEEFLELFPDAAPSASVSSSGKESSAELRLTLDVDSGEAVVTAMRRLSVAAIELGAVLGVGWLVATLAALEFRTVCGAIALTYYPLAAACSTRVPPFRWSTIKSVFVLSAPRYDVPSSRELVELVLPQTPVQNTDERIA